MSERRTTKEDILRYVASRNGVWTSDRGCDICVPLMLYNMELYLRDSGNFESAWLCDKHARELGLLW